MLGEHKTTEGFTLIAYSAAYMDWGLSIRDSEGNTVFSNPHYLSNDSYGRKPHPKFDDDWDAAETASLDGDDNAFVPWEQSDWEGCLREQADDLIEGALGECQPGC